MGDRRHVIFNYNDYTKEKERFSNIYLYSHWAGSNLQFMVRDALIHAKPRWNDDNYCARIMITHIVHSEDACMDELSWGISPFYCDSEHDDILILLKANKVKIKDKEWSFESFCDPITNIEEIE